MKKLKVDKQDPIWNGNPVDMNYAPIPEDKAESKAEIKTTLDEVTKMSNERFGLNTDGIPCDDSIKTNEVDGEVENEKDDTSGL